MTEPRQIVLRATEDEGPVWAAVLSGLNDALQDASRFAMVHATSCDTAGRDDADIVCLSLLPDLFDTEEDWPETETRLRHAAAALRDGIMARGVPVFVVTIFRHLTAKHSALLPRLRRLNLLAARLSQEFGIFVIDLDRVLAHRGARELDSDARLGSEAARRLATEVIVETLLSMGVDHLIDDAALQRALVFQQGQREIARMQLSVPTELMRLERRPVKSRSQNYSTQRDLIDDRGLAGLLRDLRAGRIGSMAFGWQIARKFAQRAARR
jgi:hypothetical protein